MKNLNLIDCAKFVLSLFVVTIHCYIVATIDSPRINGIMTMLICTSVPLFFCITSYFLFNKMRDCYWNGNVTICKERVVKTGKRLGKMYLIWFCIFNLVVNPMYEIEPLVSKFLFWGSAHLWYLWSCIICIPLIYLLLKNKVKPYMILVLGVMLYAIFRIYSHYGSVENPTGISLAFAYIWKNHLFNVYGICNGFCYLALGMTVALTKPMTNKIWLTVLFIVGILLSIPDNHRSLGIGMIPIVYVLFCLLLNNNKNTSGGVSLTLREMSIVIYLIHPIVIDLVSNWLPANRIDGWVVILTGNVILGYCYVRLKDIRGFGWMNKLI